MNRITYRADPINTICTMQNGEYSNDTGPIDYHNIVYREHVSQATAITKPVEAHYFNAFELNSNVDLEIAFGGIFP